MISTVIKAFLYSANGYTVENLKAGDERDFGSGTDGLIKAGLIAAAETKTKTTDPFVAPVVEPRVVLKPTTGKKGKS